MGLRIKLHWKENYFQTMSILSKDSSHSAPSLITFEHFTTFTALSSPDLSEEISDMRKPFIFEKPQPNLENVGCMTF